MTGKYMFCDCCSENTLFTVEQSGMASSEPFGSTLDSTLYMCVLCGDNKIVQKLKEGDIYTITEFHHVSMDPQLKKIAIIRDDNSILYDTEHDWEYYFGDKQITKKEYSKQLKDQRDVLNSMLVN